MGREAECRVAYGGQRAQRKVALETDALVVRGEPRIVVPRSSVKAARVEGAVLIVEWSGGTPVALELGAQAERWAHDLLHPKSRVEKLGVKPGMRVGLVGVSDAALRDEIEAAGAAVAGAAAKGLDLVFVQIDEAARLDAIRKAAGRIDPAGGVWVVTPRGAPGLKDVDVMAAGKAAGLVDVKVVRFSGTHSANKFVVPVAKRPKRSAAGKP